jgi:predicted anti-sigma-YlaC factor YlaD
MKCEDAKLMLADYWTRDLRGADELALEAHLADCSVCREETPRLQAVWSDLALIPVDEPGPQLRGRFYEALGAYREGAESRGRRWWQWAPGWQMAAAAALLVAGVGIGYGLKSDRTGQQVSELREEVVGMRQMVALSLLQQQSASERLRGVSWAYRAEPSDTEVLAALVSAVNDDANVNVRLAAVDALHTFSASPVTRKAVLDALPRQNMAPLVQVALIDLLVDLKERKASGELRKLSEDSAVNDGVKERALWALTKLQQQ